jgi:hypothetical protein
MVNDTESPGKETKSSEPSFQPPEVVASQEVDLPKPASASSTRKSWRDLINWRPTKKQLIIIAVVVVVLAGAVVAFAMTRTAQAPAPLKHATLTIKPVSSTVPSTLTGLPVAPSVNQRPVTGVMIENSTGARPQSGLDQAGVVFEAVAEGGITRFLALFQDTQPSYIGPVRSARPYYVQWCLGFDCALAHVGGSPEALSDITSWNVKNLDQFYNGSYYQRITSRFAPHNVYTSIAQLNTLEASKGFGAPQFSGFARKVDQPAKTPAAASIDINPSSVTYASHYDYDAAANAYKRSEGGAAHMEVSSNGVQTQIEPKVVIGLVMQQGIEADDLHTSYTTIGSGQAYVFQDGGVTTGTWQKTSNTSQFTFTTSSGQTIKLNAGQTWITVVGSASDVSYK